MNCGAKTRWLNTGLLIVFILASASLGICQLLPSPGTTQMPRSGLPQPDTLSHPVIPPRGIGIGPPLTEGQKDALIKQNFKKTRQDVAKLAKMVHVLQQEIDKTNPNVLSLDVWRQANKIQKLAKKIKGETKMY